MTTADARRMFQLACRFISVEECIAMTQSAEDLCGESDELPVGATAVTFAVGVGFGVEATLRALGLTPAAIKPREGLS